MQDNIDKTRPEQLGERTFVGTGVGTIPDIMEEQKDLRQMIQDMINEALKAIKGTRDTIARAKVAKIDVAAQEDQVNDAEQRLLAIKAGFFPSGRAT